MNAENSSKSWQQPTSRIKLKVKKRRPSKSSYQVDNQAKASAINQDGIVSVKRSNPFGCSTTAKRRPSNSTNSFDNRLFQALDGNIDVPKYPQDVQCAKITEVIAEQPESSAKEEQNNDVSHDDNNEHHHVFPIDWSLKTKARFTSSTSFSWTGSLKSAETADSITRFVRCHEGDCNSVMLHSACNVWIHPSMPSMQLFPRHSSIKKYDDDIVSGLQKEWVSSFHSLFNLLRCGHCGYFYMCTSQCTILFMTDTSGMGAVITPTTKGFRDALDREGI